MIKITTIILVSFNITFFFGQFKMDANSRFGFGTMYPNTAYRCHIAGNLLCTSYPSNPSYELRFKVGNGWPWCEIGASSDVLAFWTTEFGYNSLRASDYVKVSDSTVKFEFAPIGNALERIKKIHALKYKMEDDKIDGETGKTIKKVKSEFGFLSQEVKRVFPESNITTIGHNGLILLDYDQMVPIAFSAIQEQQKIIDSLGKSILELNEKIQIILSNRSIDIQEKGHLYPCIPNPSNESTRIFFSLNYQSFENAEIVIYNDLGVKILNYSILSDEENYFDVTKNQIGVGVFNYSLFVNGLLIDSKKLIFE